MPSLPGVARRARFSPRSADHFTGLKGVARLMQWLVPIMALLWVAASLFVAALHIDQVPGVIATIFKSAFGWRSGLWRAGLHLQPGADGGFSAGHVLQ
jgi:AGCS family alanine or glycine:cation symporter